MIAGFFSKMLAGSNVIAAQVATRAAESTVSTGTAREPVLDTERIMRTLIGNGELPGLGSIKHPFFNNSGYGVQNTGGRQGPTGPSLAALGGVGGNSGVAGTGGSKTSGERRLALQEYFMRAYGAFDLYRLISYYDSVLGLSNTADQLPNYNSASLLSYATELVKIIEPLMNGPFFDILASNKDVGRPGRAAEVRRLQHDFFPETLGNAPAASAPATQAPTPQQAAPVTRPATPAAKLVRDPQAHDDLKTALTPALIGTLDIDADDIEARFQSAGYIVPALKAGQSAVDYFRAHPETLPAYLQINIAEDLMDAADASSILDSCNNATIEYASGGDISRKRIKERGLSKLVNLTPQQACDHLIQLPDVKDIKKELAGVLDELRHFSADPRYKSAFHEALCSRLMEYPDVLELIMIALRSAATPTAGTAPAKPVAPAAPKAQTPVISPVQPVQTPAAPQPRVVDMTSTLGVKVTQKDVELTTIANLYKFIANIVSVQSNGNTKELIAITRNIEYNPGSPLSHHIVTGGSLNDLAYNIVETANRAGLIGEFLEQLANKYPQDAVLQEFLRAYQ